MPRRRFFLTSVCLCVLCLLSKKPQHRGRRDSGAPCKGSCRTEDTKNLVLVAEPMYRPVISWTMQRRLLAAFAGGMPTVQWIPSKRPENIQPLTLSTFTM
jgi:hypothetical protein